MNPVDPQFGAATFGADGANGLRAVTDHAVHMPGGTGYFDPGTESLWNIAHATTDHADAMFPYVRAPMTRVVPRSVV